MATRPDFSANDAALLIAHLQRLDTARAQAGADAAVAGVIRAALPAAAATEATRTRLVTALCEVRGARWSQQLGLLSGLLADEIDRLEDDQAAEAGREGVFVPAASALFGVGAGGAGLRTLDALGDPANPLNVWTPVVGLLCLVVVWRILRTRSKLAEARRDRDVALRRYARLRDEIERLR